MLHHESFAYCDVFSAYCYVLMCPGHILDDIQRPCLSFLCYIKWLFLLRTFEARTLKRRSTLEARCEKKVLIKAFYCSLLQL